MPLNKETRAIFKLLNRWMFLGLHSWGYRASVSKNHSRYSRSFCPQYNNAINSYRDPLEHRYWHAKLLWASSDSSHIIKFTFGLIPLGKVWIPLLLTSRIVGYIVPLLFLYDDGFHQWLGNPQFNPRSSHTKDSKNDTWCLLA